VPVVMGTEQQLRRLYEMVVERIWNSFIDRYE
jgi:hypothetical protein